MGKIGVLIVDDHRVVRQGIISFLEVQDDVEVKGEAADGQEAVRLAEELKPDVILMDLLMPGVNGIEAIRQIKSFSPKTRIIVLTSFIQNDKVFPAIKAGADGYLLKDASPAELITAIKAVMEGKPALHPDIAQKLMYLLSDRKKADTVEKLTQRETEVLGLIAEGMSNNEIANRLVISVRTVKTHVHNILRKLGMTQRVQAALYAANKNGYQSGGEPFLDDKEEDIGISG